MFSQNLRIQFEKNELRVPETIFYIIKILA